MRTAPCLVAIVGALLANARPAMAESTPLEWNPTWPRVGAIEYTATAAAGAGALGVYLFVHTKTNPSWEGGIFFDDAVRDGLRLRSPGARDTIRAFSDGAAIATVAYAAFDSVVLPLAKGSGDVAWQLAWVDAESFAYDTLLVTSMYDVIGRGRPSYADCQRDPSFDPLCKVGSTASFPSGHTGTAFTAAGLSCAHHRALPLYGGGAWDTVGCAAILTMATTTGTLRLMGDRHYATDVIAGGLIGFAIGFSVPTFAHYGWSRPTPKQAASLQFGVGPAGAPIGLSATGTF